MPRKRIDELTERTDFDSTCELPLHDGVQTWKTTAAKILAYIQAYLEPSISAQTANYAILATDWVITMSASGGARTVTLPTAVGRSGKTYTIKKIDSSGNTVQLLTTAAQTIDGFASGALYLYAQYDSIKVVSDGANWLILEKRLPVVNAQTASYAIVGSDDLVTMDASGGSRTLTLPTAVGRKGKVYTLKKIDSGSNTVQVLTTSSQTIDGNNSGTLYLRLQYDTIRVQSDGANWLILDLNFGLAGGNLLVSW